MVLDLDFVGALEERNQLENPGGIDNAVVQEGFVVLQG